MRLADRFAQSLHRPWARRAYWLQAELAELLPGCAGLDVVDSKYGHDGFLLETEAVGKLIRRTLELAER